MPLSVDRSVEEPGPQQRSTEPWEALKRTPLEVEGSWTPGASEPSLDYVRTALRGHGRNPTAGNTESRRQGGGDVVGGVLVNPPLGKP